MAVINRRLQLRDINSNLVFPRASLDNIQRSKNDGRDALIVTLNDSGHIDASLLPELTEFVVMLRTVSNTAPLNPAAGDRYYDISQNKIYTYANSSWGTGATPETMKLYIATDTEYMYRYNGTALTDISTHFTVVQSVAVDPTSAISTGVPSEHAVSVALQRKQDKVYGATPITIDNDSTVSLHYSNGLHVVSNNLEVEPKFIARTVDSLMLSDAGPADQSTAYVNGGTVYTILGNCSITTSVASTGASDTKVPTEAAVRSAVNAAIATGGSTVVPGKAIDVTGGSINVTPSTVVQAVGSTSSTGATSVTKVAADDLSAFTPKALLSAMSLGQAVDVSTDIFVGGGTKTYANSSTTYLGKINWSVSTGSSSGSLGFGFWSAHPFPPFITGHVYLFLCDIKLTSATAGSVNVWFSSGVYYTANKTLSQNQSCRHAGLLTAATQNFGFYAVTAANVSYTYEITNCRQYDVTDLTDDARRFLALMPEPDLFFRNSSIANVNGKYLIKNDMVSPYIPIMTQPNNTDLDIVPGRAYSLTFTDNNTHKIKAAVFPSDAWAKESFLQLTVTDPTKVVFDGINLMSTLRANAINNIIIKFRAGNVNAYNEDTDAGYVVTLNSGSQNGSLAYGLGNNVGNYIVFSDTTNIT